MTDYLVDRTDCFLEVIVELVWNGDWIPGEGERMSQRHKDRRIQAHLKVAKCQERMLTHGHSSTTTQKATEAVVGVCGCVCIRETMDVK